MHCDCRQVWRVVPYIRNWPATGLAKHCGAPALVKRWIKGGVVRLLDGRSICGELVPVLARVERLKAIRV